MQRLREHSARMHGDGLVQPAHTCAECGREFITTSAYKLHMRKFHSVIITDEDIDASTGDTLNILLCMISDRRQYRGYPEYTPVHVQG